MEHLLSSLEPEKASIVRRYVDKILPAGATGAAGNTSDTDSADSLTNESEKASNSQPSAGFAALVEDSARMLQRRSLEVVKLPTRMKISPSVSVDVDGRTVRQTAKGVSTVTAKAQSLVFEDLPRFKDAENGVALSAPPHDTQAQKRATKVKARRSAPGGGFMSTTHSPPRFSTPQPRPHRSDPKGFSYVTSYSQQRKDNEALHRSLQHSNNRLAASEAQLVRRSDQVRLLEGVMEAQEKHVDSLTDQLDEANKKLEQCESTIQQLSRSGDLTALALADEKDRHAKLQGRLSELEQSSSNTIEELQTRAKEQSSALRQERDQLSADKQALQQRLTAAEARADNLQREVDVLREVMREKQSVLTQQEQDLASARNERCTLIAAHEQDQQAIADTLADARAQNDQLRAALGDSQAELQRALKDARQEAQAARSEADRLADRLQRDIAQARELHTQELRLAAREHEAMSGKYDAARQDISRLRGDLQLKTDALTESTAEIEHKTEREKHMWAQLAARDQALSDAKAELEVAAHSLAAAKSEADAAGKKSEMWQTKAAVAERAGQTAQQEVQTLSADVARAEADADAARKAATDAQRQFDGARLELESARRLLQQYRTLSFSLQTSASDHGQVRHFSPSQRHPGSPRQHQASLLHQSPLHEWHRTQPRLPHTSAVTASAALSSLQDGDMLSDEYLDATACTSPKHLLSTSPPNTHEGWAAGIRGSSQVNSSQTSLRNQHDGSGHRCDESIAGHRFMRPRSASPPLSSAKETRELDEVASDERERMRAYALDRFREVEAEMPRAVSKGLEPSRIEDVGNSRRVSAHEILRKARTSLLEPSAGARDQSEAGVMKPLAPKHVPSERMRGGQLERIQRGILEAGQSQRIRGILEDVLASETTQAEAIESWRRTFSAT